MRPYMRRARRWAAIAGWAVAWLAAAPLPTAEAAGRAKPNIVVILADDLGHADLGFQGCRDIPTPRIDSLASCGVRCGNGYVSGPYCSPTRAGLLTGRYQQRFGHEFNPAGNRATNFGLPLTETTIADRLKGAGYATGLVGKWHLGEQPQFRPRRRGFDEFFGFLGGAHTYVPGKGAPIYRGDEVVEEREYLTDAFGREAVAFVERHKAHPFFLYLAFNAVHTPMDATDARLKRFAAIGDTSRRTYAAMLAAMDESVGRVLDAIRGAGLEEDTLIVFLSDNGGPTMLGTTINASRNDPFRGSKRTTLEGGIHVPFVVQWKGKLPAGRVYDRPVIQLDILPTALAAAGVPVDPKRQLDGVNLLPHLKGESAAPPHDALFWRMGEQNAIRRGDWKLVRYDEAADHDDKRSEPAHVEVTPARLYNLADDAGERHDLAAEHPEKVHELSTLWESWNARLARPLWGPGIAPTASLLAPIGPILLATLPPTAPAPAAPRNAESLAFFERKVRPLLVGQCYTCHSADTNSRGGLRVDDRNGLLQGGNGGPAVVPGKPEESLLLMAVRHEEGAPRMPPKKHLTAEQVADLSRWIRDGAAWPEADGSPAAGREKPDPKYEALRRSHWAWQPLAPTPPPRVRDASWPAGDIDRFLLARLEREGLAPVGDADRLTLIRRLTFDLNGLPPTPEEVDAFLADRSADAYERLVDRLLASPAYGERWGRHWLDVARYGESSGGSRNLPLPHAWRYRDYVVDAFNSDKPYDRFIREQVAGDLLPAGSERERAENRIATGFLAIGVKDVNQRFKVRFVMDNVDEQIDAVSRGFLGLTASCARCHDHKFDPIPTADYYALAGIFRSTDLCDGLRNKMGGGGLDYYDTDQLIRLEPAVAPDAATRAKIEKAQAALEAAKAEFERVRDDPEGDKPGPDGRPRRAIARQAMNQAARRLLTLTDPAARGGKIALGVRDARVVGDTEIRIRGEAEKLGPIVARGFLGVVPVDAPKVDPRRSGRLELAAWLTGEANPLTPRVMVNRAWQHLFGRGLVSTVDNFGVKGDRPSHPELLDHLAAGFVRDGWSVKRLVRTIVLSRAYRLGPEATAHHLAIDPANRLVWRHSPRRLDAEEIRDAALAAAGVLDPARPEGSPARDLRVVELPNNGPLARRLMAEAAASRHRSLYLPLLRGLVPRSLEVFDFAEQGMVTGSRETTTVAPQALYLLNDPFVRRRALDLAVRLLRRDDPDDARVDRAYRLTLGRPASAKEVRRARDYLADYESAAAAIPPEPDAAKRDEPPAARPSPKGPTPVNPDEVPPEEAPVVEEVVRAPDARTAAWASFCQALLGGAEFRYVN